MEFLDFYPAGKTHGKKAPLKYLVFDRKFTPYENLRKLDDRGVYFITILRRGKSIVDKLEKLPKSKWKKVRVMNADGKGRVLRIYEEAVVRWSPFFPLFSKTTSHNPLTGDSITFKCKTIISGICIFNCDSFSSTRQQTEESPI